MRSCIVAAALVSISLGLAGGYSIAAEDNEVGLGIYEKPQYLGADEQEWVVLPSFKYHSSRLSLILRGERLMLDLVPSSKLNAGLLVRYDEGRDEGIDDDVVRQLASVPAAAELGLYLESGLPVTMLGWDDPTLIIGTVNLRDAVGAGHKGQVLEVAAGLFREWDSSTSITAQFILTRTDTDYNRAYFGVSAAEAAETGLTAFSPEAGLKDTQVQLVLTHDIKDDWTIGLTTTYGRLSDKLADSPVVSVRGDREQWTTGLYLNHHL